MEARELFQGVEHIGIKTAQMDQAIEFYTNVLGFNFLQRIKPGSVELAFLSLGGTVVELVEIEEGQHFEDGLVNHLCLKVADIFQAVSWLKENHVTLMQEEPRSMGEGRYNFFFRGPSGEKLELYQVS